MGQGANHDVSNSAVAGDFRRSALNLLQDCAGARPGESLLILAEDPELGYYGPGLAEAVAAEAEALGSPSRCGGSASRRTLTRCRRT